jgi:hypothetical protein
MPREQKVCCTGSEGYRDQLLISNAILPTQQEENVCMAWIDYHKAFDSVPQSLIIQFLELTGINNKISFTKKPRVTGRKVCAHIEKIR